MNQVKLSSSFVNQAKHEKKSDRFEVIQPSHLAEVLNDHGFDLVHLKTSKSKIEANKDFQTTIARYRSRDQFDINGLSLDIIIKAPHIYGAIETVLGLFRGVCSNQLNVGNQFENFKIKHIGDPLNQLNSIIPQLVNQQHKLVDVVSKMKNVELSNDLMFALALESAKSKLDGHNVLHVDTKKMLTARRSDDFGRDLFSVYNVIQENIQRQGISYIESIIDVNGASKNVVSKTRIMRDNTQATIEFNKQLFDIASSFIERGV